MENLSSTIQAMTVDSVGNSPEVPSNSANSENASPSTAEVAICDTPGIRICEFTETLLDHVLHGKIFFMDASCFIWLGDSTAEPCLMNMVCSMQTRFEKMPLVTQVTGGDGGSEDLSSPMARRLAKKTGLQVFLACSLSGNCDEILLQVEQKLLALLMQDRDQKSLPPPPAPTSAPSV